MLLSPENRFLLASIGADFIAEARNELQLLSQEVDWTLLIETAYQHGINGLLCHCLLNVCSETVPEQLLIAAAEHQKIMRRRNQQFASQLASIASKLSSGNIEIIPFKGIVLCQRIYGDLALRSFSDLDFLIQKHNRNKALSGLNELGFDYDQGLTQKQQEAYYDYGGQDNLFGDGAPIEPHWAFAPNTFSLIINYNDWWDRSYPDVFEGEKIRVFNAEDEFILLCIHGGKEKWTKLKWLADLGTFITKTPELDWDIIFQRSAEQGVERMVYLGLQLCRELLLMKFSQQICLRLDADISLPGLVLTAQTNLFDEFASNQSIYSLSSFHWQLRERWSDRLRYVFLTLITPRTTHFQMLSLPDSLFFLYYPVKLVHDYLLLPQWLLLKSLLNIKREAR